MEQLEKDELAPPAPRPEKPAEGLAESMLVMVICLVVAVGIIRLAVEEVNSLFARVATILGLGETERLGPGSQTGVENCFV